MKKHASEVLQGIDFAPISPLGPYRAAFLGCGDSLAAARPAEQLGHRVLSAGDVAWSGQAPIGVDVAVALSWSGRTDATIAAAKICKQSDLQLISITTDPDSPLAVMADRSIILPTFDFSETIPALGYVIHSAALIELCTGQRIDLSDFSDRWRNAARDVSMRVEPLLVAPQGISVISMPEVHGAGEFWMLKLIEALGLSVRWAPVEEVGHVDYFIGPQSHFDFLLSGDGNPERLLRLGSALEENGHLTTHIGFDIYSGWPAQVMAGALGADWAEALSLRWGRPPFRGGVVDMSAAHIQIRPLPQVVSVEHKQ